MLSTGCCLATYDRFYADTNTFKSRHNSHASTNTSMRIADAIKANDLWLLKVQRLHFIGSSGVLLMCTSVIQKINRIMQLPTIKIS